MQFKNLEERMLYFRSLADYRLTPNSYVLCMIDGRGFSHKIKKRFKLPFDDTFINIMNEVAAFICKEVQGCKFAYAQSDEISFVITDFETPETDAFFGYRLCKMQSLIAAMASAKFNQLMVLEACKIPCTNDDIRKTVEGMPAYHFDCKCWTVPTYNDVVGWFLYRQNDCVKNSKQQAAQTYLPHKELAGKHTDEQVEMLKEKCGIDWHIDYDDGKKYGRFIYKDTEHFVSEDYGEYDRSVWRAHNGKVLTYDFNREELSNYIPKR